MTVASFTQRVARERHRFVTSLESKIEDTYAALPELSRKGFAGIVVVDESYRRMHNIVRIGPMVGFIATWRAARTVENVLLPAQSARRGLNADEIDMIEKALQVLREASQRELQSIFANWR
jgi:hypothetical protein